MQLLSIDGDDYSMIFKLHPLTQYDCVVERTSFHKEIPISIGINWSAWLRSAQPCVNWIQLNHFDCVLSTPQS